MNACVISHLNSKADDILDFTLCFSKKRGLFNETDSTQTTPECRTPYLMAVFHNGS